VKVELGGEEISRAGAGAARRTVYLQKEQRYGAVQQPRKMAALILRIRAFELLMTLARFGPSFFGKS
jgi:hypothetical protein